MMKRFLLLLVAAFGLSALAAPDAPSIRVAFLSDTHVNLNTNGPRVFNGHVDKAFAEANAANVDLVLITGDLTDSGQPAQMDLFKQKAAQLKAPVVFIPGNHDVGRPPGIGRTNTVTSEKLERFSQQLGPNWFARDVAGLHIIGINSCLFGTGFKEEEEQWEFLEQALAKPNPKPTLLLEHYPLYVCLPNEPGTGVLNIQSEARQRMLKLIEQGGVRAVLSGHLHYPVTNRLDGILFLSNTAVAYAVPRNERPPGWMLLSIPPQGEPRIELHTLESTEPDVRAAAPRPGRDAVLLPNAP